MMLFDERREDEKRERERERSAWGKASPFVCEMLVSLLLIYDISCLFVDVIDIGNCHI